MLKQCCYPWCAAAVGPACCCLCCPGGAAVVSATLAAAGALRNAGAVDAYRAMLQQVGGARVSSISILLFGKPGLAMLAWAKCQGAAVCLQDSHCAVVRCAVLLQVDGLLQQRHGHQEVLVGGGCSTGGSQQEWSSSTAGRGSAVSAVSDTRPG